MPSYFLHYPRLVTESSVEVLNGTLRTLDFETFETLEDDWAKQSYFEATKPVFWIRTGDDVGRATTTESGDSAEDPFAPARADAMLIYNALLAVTGELYPDPRLSMEYFRNDDAWRRRIGPFERTWLLNARGLEPTAEETLLSVAALAESWHERGFHHDDRVFSPLRGLASLASTFMSPALGMLPLIVSLEGFLLPTKVEGIARSMADAIRRLLADSASEDIAGFMRDVYQIRSELLHGRTFPAEDLSAICGALQQLTGSVVIAAAGEMMKRPTELPDFDALQKEWLAK